MNTKLYSGLLLILLKPQKLIQTAITIKGNWENEYQQHNPAEYGSITNLASEGINTDNLFRS